MEKCKYTYINPCEKKENLIFQFISIAISHFARPSHNIYGY